MVTVAMEEAAASSTEQRANIRVVAEARDLLPARSHHCFERRNESHTSQLPNQFSRGERYSTHLCQFYRWIISYPSMQNGAWCLCSMDQPMSPTSIRMS
ncbi:unnamed protein product [Sphagnum jensenii]|uniref:Uncharacterized protein n=1 Tax=Sphagnum jensenii TaxID=128206 RepID=A0ABP1BW90_9BRYO